MKEEIIYCDDCGEKVYRSSVGLLIPHTDYAILPFDIASAIKGESGTVCVNCEKVRRFSEEVPE